MYQLQEKAIGSQTWKTITEQKTKNSIDVALKNRRKHLASYRRLTVVGPECSIVALKNYPDIPEEKNEEVVSIP